MPDALKVKSRKVVWLDDNGKETSPPTGGFLGIGATHPHKHEITTYDNGEIWDAVDDGEPFYVKTDAQMAENYRAGHKTAPEPSATSQWSIQTRADGSKWRVNELTGETEPLQGFGAKAAQTNTWTDPTDGSQWIIDEQTGAKVKQLSGPIAGWTAGRGVVAAPQRAPRYPEEEQLARLGVAKAQRDLLSPQQLAFQNHFETIDQLQGMLERGEITPDKAGAYMDASRQYLDAALQGTTPFQQTQAKQRQKEFEQGLGESILNQRLSSGASLASALTNAATSLAGRATLHEGQRYTFDPLAAAQSFTDQAGGGQDVTALARSLLLGSQAGGGATPGVAGAPAPTPLPGAIGADEMNRLLAGG